MSIILFSGGIVLTLLTLGLVQNLLPKRRNYAGSYIPNSAGMALIPIILITLALSAASISVMGGEEIAYLLYSIAAGLVGLADDLWGGGGRRGFRGHLGALVRGGVTTGLVKVLVLGGGALVFAGYVFGIGVEALVAAVLMAGSVNLANLFDVRPGRALKFVGAPVLALLFVAPFGSVAAVIGVVGGTISLFYFDVRERIMLGDAGAAVLGSVLGYLVVAGGPGVIWWPSLAVILGLTVVAEVSSISKVIEEVGALRRFDRWGRGNG